MADLSVIMEVEFRRKIKSALGEIPFMGHNQLVALQTALRMLSCGSHNGLCEGIAYYSMNSSKDRGAYDIVEAKK